MKDNFLFHFEVTTKYLHYNYVLRNRHTHRKYSVFAVKNLGGNNKRDLCVFRSSKNSIVKIQIWVNVEQLR